MSSSDEMENFDFEELHVCEYPDNCTKCRIDNILFCKVWKRHLHGACSYNNHLTGKQHKKLEKRNGCPPSKPLEFGDADYYVHWPPSALDSSSPIQGAERRTRATSGLNLLTTMSRWTPCFVCKKLIGFNVLCWETKLCGHLIHETCRNRRFRVNCEHCTIDKILT